MLSRRRLSAAALWSRHPVSRAIDAFAIVLLAGAACAFAFGVYALGDHQDFKALYLLIVGGLALKASTELLRPRGGSS